MRATTDFLLPLVEQAERLAETEPNRERRKKHRRLARHLIQHLARSISKRRPRWWFEVEGRP